VDRKIHPIVDLVLRMTIINFSDKDLFLSIFEGYNNDFEYTADGVFRRATQP